MFGSRKVLGKENREESGKKERKKWGKIKNKFKIYKLFLYTILSSFNLFNSIIYQLKNINIYIYKITNSNYILLSFMIFYDKIIYVF